MRAHPGLAAVLALLAGCTSASEGAAPPSEAPHLQVSVVGDGLDHSWDVAQASDSTLLFDQRGGGFTAVRRDRGETGLMGLVLDPSFDTDRRFYSCQGVTDGANPSSAVIAWTGAADWRSATRMADPLIGDIPVNASSGRHGGCRLRFTPDGALLIGTGDNAVGTNPQDRSSRAGRCCSSLRPPARQRSGTTDTATCRGSPSGRARARSSAWSRAPTATTR